jgi:hypothetical protein
VVYSQKIDRAEKLRANEKVRQILLMDDEFSEYAEAFTGIEEPDQSNACVGEVAPKDVMDREPDPDVGDSEQHDAVIGSDLEEEDDKMGRDNNKEPVPTTYVPLDSLKREEWLTEVEARSDEELRSPRMDQIMAMVDDNVLPSVSPMRRSLSCQGS